MTKYFKTLKRALLTVVGPFSTAGANLVLSLLLIGHITPTEYGVFAFTTLLVYYTQSAVNASSATPISIMLNKNGVEFDLAYGAAAIANNFVCILLFFISAFCSYLLIEDLISSLLLGAWVGLNGQRWFLRSVEYALHSPTVAAISDISQSAILLVSVGGLFLYGEISLLSVSSVLVATNAASVLGLRVRRNGRRSRTVTERLTLYKEVWRDQVRWALVGVTSTEMSSQGYAYIVTFMLGPAAFAPLAVAALLWRPVATFFSSIVSIERPVLARYVAAKDFSGAGRTLRYMRALSLLAVALNGSAIMLFMLLGTEYLTAKGYDYKIVFAATCMWFIIVSLRAYRIPENVYAQALGEFKKLSNISSTALPIILIAATLLALFLGPIYSLFAVIASELYASVRTRRLIQGVLAGERYTVDNGRSPDVPPS